MSKGRPSQLVDDKERDDVAEPGAAALGLGMTPARGA